MSEKSTVYVGGLGTNVTEEMIEDYFSYCGTIVNMRLAGFVCFSKKKKKLTNRKIYFSFQGSILHFEIRIY